MKIEGFTYVRNGLKMGYPFIASIQSLLPIVSKLIVVLGDSDDGSREAIENLKNEKIVIVDNVWKQDDIDPGGIFREQSNIGVDHLSGDWAIHLQADEVLKDSDHIEILKYIKIADEMDDVDGLLFPFNHFWGDFKYVRNTRRTHAFEIRAFKNHRNVRSYKDSQGFRKFDPSLPEHKGDKLLVLKTDIPIYHYPYTRNPKLINKKAEKFRRYLYQKDPLDESASKTDFDFNEVDRLDVFEGDHPIYMNDIIAKQDWVFEYDPSRSNMRLKDKLLYPLEKFCGIRLFEYRNYKLTHLPTNKRTLFVES